MRKKEKARLLIIVTVGAGLIGIAGCFIEDDPTSNDRSYWRNSGGAVMFEHQAHTDMTEGCESCHHDLLSADSRIACNECHDDDMVTEDFEHSEFEEIEAHTCATCHELDESAEAQSCRICHPAAQEADQPLITCIECHDDEYTIDLLTHDEMQETHEQDCAVCHNSETISAVYHLQCSQCHLIENNQMFADAEGKPRCERCHLK